MIIQCSHCNKKFHKKPDKVAYIENKPYCSNCFKLIDWRNKVKREEEKRNKKLIYG